jgi:4-hydroxy-3-polyprenylbenzoate decarboxylase
MAIEDLREFISTLEKRGQLSRIRAEVDPDLEIAEITDRVSKRGGPALFFENVRGHSIPVLINALGSRERMMLALGVRDYGDITERINELTDVKSPQGLIEKIKMIPRLADIGKMFPKIVKDGPCKERVLVDGKFSLLDLPIIKCWPEDGGRFITMPLVFTKKPGDRETELWDVPHAGLRRNNHRHALADTQARRAAFSKLEAKRWRPTSSRRRHRRGSDHNFLRDYASTGRPGRNDDRRVSAGEAGRDGQVRDR